MTCWKWKNEFQRSRPKLRPLHVAKCQHQNDATNVLPKSQVLWLLFGSSNLERASTRTRSTPSANKRFSSGPGEERTLQPESARSGAYVEKVNLIFTFGGSLDLANLWIISYESNTQFVTYNLHLSDAPGEPSVETPRQQAWWPERWNRSACHVHCRTLQAQNNILNKTIITQFSIIGMFRNVPNLSDLEQPWTAHWLKGALSVPKSLRDSSYSPSATGPVVSREFANGHSSLC